MAFIYEIKPNGADGLHSQNARWLAAIVRMKYRRTYNPSFVGKAPKPRKQLNDPEAQEIIDGLAETIQEVIDELPSGLTSASRDAAKENPVAELDTIVLDNAIIQYQESHGKGDHVASLQFTLSNIGVNFSRDLCAGDWILFWTFDNEEDKNRVKQLILQGKPANDFESGLKFIGTLNAPRRMRTTAPDGSFRTLYKVSAAGFKEFNSVIYYNEMLAAKYQNETLQWMMDFGGEVNNFILKATDSSGSTTGAITSQDAIPKLLRICLGMGPGEESKGFNPYVLDAKDQEVDQASSDLQSSPNQAYQIPQTVGKLLGLQASDAAKPVGLTYADIIQLYCGVEEYTSPGNPSNRTVQGQQQYIGLVPGKKADLDGEFLPSVISFNQKSVWSILSSYLVDPVNEMFTCMKVNKDGKIMPSFICRQMPFSSNLFASAGFKATQFTSLPRWSISASLVLSDDLGPSDAMRINYIHLPGQDTTGGNVGFNQVLNYVRNPPAVNDADIRRNGLCMFTKQLNAKIIETQYSNNDSPGKLYTKLMADVMMDGHLRWSGTLNCKLIQEPIAPGDNVLFDGGIYHIERVTHTGGIDGNGKPTAGTSLQLTYGISALTDADSEGYNIFLTGDEDVDLTDPIGPATTVA